MIISSKNQITRTSGFCGLSYLGRGGRFSGCGLDGGFGWT